MDKNFKNLIISNKTKTSSLTGWYTVTPAFAKCLLELNVKNYRKVNNNRVNAYAIDMAAGKWKKNGETIVVGQNGILQDGQHRLHAIVKSGATIECFIVFDADITDLYNVGSVRNVGTMFNAEGKPINCFNVATGRMILHYGTGTDSLGTAVVHDYVEEKIDLIKLACSIANGSGNVGRKAACAAIVYGMLKTHEMSESDMRTFFKVVNSGTTYGCLKEASPALVLRKQLMEMAKGGGHAGQKTQLEITYKALRDFKLGNQRKLAYKDDTNDGMRFLCDVYEMDEKTPTVA